MSTVWSPCTRSRHCSFDRAFRDDETGWDLWTLSTESCEARLWVANPVLDTYPRFSPDGRWVAFSTDQSGSREIHVRSFPDGERETVVSTDGGTMPAWSGDGRRLYFRRGSSVWFSELGEADGKLVPRAPELLFDGPFRANERAACCRRWP